MMENIALNDITVDNAILYFSMTVYLCLNYLQRIIDSWLQCGSTGDVCYFNQFLSHFATHR